MNKNNLIILFLNLISPIIAKHSNVIDLSEKNFHKLIAKYDTLLMLFYDLSDRESVEIEPEFEKAADKLLKNNPPVILAKFDCSTKFGKQLCLEYGTPDLRIFKDGEFYDYCIDCYDSESIVEYMKKRVGSNSKQYKSFRELKKELTTTKEVIVLGIFESNKKTEYDSQSQFFKASDRLRQSVLFRHVFIDSVPEVYDFDLLKNLRDMSPPNIVLIRPKHLRNKFEPNYVVYAFGDIKDFIKINYHGLVGFRNRSNIDYFEPPIVIVYFEVNYENNTKKTNSLRNIILRVAHNHKDLKFAFSDVHYSAPDLKGYGFESLEEVLDSIPIITARDSYGQKFITKNKFSFQNLENFVHDFKNERLEPFVLSEKLPNPDKKGKVIKEEL